MADLIDRQQEIDAVDDYIGTFDAIDVNFLDGLKTAKKLMMQLPSAQPEQTKMIKEIRKWINSGNRGSADYFIVDKIEEIINKYE